MWSEHRFLSYDATPLFFRRLTVKDPRGAVLIVHGMGEHGGRYTEFAEFLGSKSFSCAVPDLRGFGKSGGKPGCLRHFSDYFADLDSVRRALRASGSSPGNFLIGHSYGGLIAAQYLASRPDPAFRGLVLSSPNFGISLHVPPWRHLLGLAGSVLFPDFTQSNRVDRTRLTHDPQSLKQRSADPLIHDRISARLYAELVSRIASAPSAAAQITEPALVMQAGDDRVVSRDATVGFFNALGSRDKSLEILEGQYHEILNETARLTTYARIADWLIART